MSDGYVWYSLPVALKSLRDQRDFEEEAQMLTLNPLGAGNDRKSLSPSYQILGVESSRRLKSDS